ncbi:proto-oncogene Mas-like [Lissotriton helveticus]
MSEDKSRYLNLTAASSDQPVRSRAQKCLPCGSGRSCPQIISFHPPRGPDVVEATTQPGEAVEEGGKETTLRGARVQGKKLMSEDTPRYLNLTAASSEQPVTIQGSEVPSLWLRQKLPSHHCLPSSLGVRCSGGHNPAWRSSGARRQRNYIERKPEYWSEYKRERALEDSAMADAGSISSNITNTPGFNETMEDNSVMDSSSSFIIAAGFILFISFCGIIGNSLVFWYLCFKIKRTKYTIYIINLAVADLIYLIFISVVMCITILLFLNQKPAADPLTVLFGLEIVLGLGNYADMFLLTAISVERCLATYHPMWYRYKRPSFQSLLVCLISWSLSILVTLVDNLGCPSDKFGTVAAPCTTVHTFLSVLVFLLIIPTMVISSLIMLIMVKKSSKQNHPPKLVIVIVATVIVFLISVAPVRVLWLLLYLQVLPSGFSAGAFFFAVYMCISINSSINPYIYFLVGRQKMQGVWNFLEKALKKVFGEEEDNEEGEKGVTKHREEGDTTESNIS